MNSIDNSTYADFEWAVQLNRFNLELIGLWPQKATNCRETWKANLRVFVTVISITCVCAIPSLHALVKVWGDMTAVIDNLLVTLPFVTLCLKLLIMWWKKETISPLVTMIAHDWIKSKSSDERYVMIRRAQNARFILICSYCVMITSLTLLAIIAGLGYSVRYVTNVTYTERPLPMQVYYIFDATVSPYFEIMFLLQCITSVMIAITYTGIDNFLGLLIFHICGQLENLTMRLNKMSEVKDFTSNLKINVIDHIRLIRSVAIVENTFALVLFLLFLYSGILTCICGFLFATLMSGEGQVSGKRIIFLLAAAGTASTHMCLYCAVGELLVAKCEDVYKAICECKWYTLKMEEARTLILLMVRMKKPLYITAGKILPMTMSTFCSILKTSGGYISVLLANRN